jgi:HEAT repeat protein
MRGLMNKSFWRVALIASSAMVLAACGNKETKAALDKSTELENQKQYSDANDILIRALQAREAEIRAAAGNSSDPTATDALIKKVKADSEILKMERKQVVIYLRWDRADLASAVYTDVLTGAPDDTSIYDLLHDPDTDVRRHAVEVLGLVADPKSPNLGKTIDALVVATKDADAKVRAAAVDALGATKDPRALQPIADKLKDTDWDVRFEAVNALSELHDERAVAPLLDATGDSEKTVRESAHENLETIVSGQATLAKPDDFAPRLNDPNPYVSMTAAECMGLLRDARAVPVLLTLVTSKDLDVRVNAIKGLGESGDRSTLPILRQMLNDPDLNMRGWSIIGLGKLKDEDSLMDLEHIATDDTQPSAIREAAAASADEIKSSLPPLEAP